MIHKQVLVPDRVRRPPTDGWSWIDRRFLREHAARLSHEAIVLYFFLAAVSDKDGLSFYGDASIALRLRMGEAVVVRPATNWWRRTWWPTGRRWRRCSPCPPPRSSVAAAVWPPSARFSAAWPIPLPLALHGGPHESLSLGGNPPLARDRRSQGPGDCPPLALLQQNRRQGFGDVVATHARRRSPGKRSSTAYRARIDALLAKYPDLSAVRVTEEISKGEDGYRGSVYPVRRYLHQVRPARGRVYQEVLYEPGEAMQVDWGDCGRVMIGQTPTAGFGLRGGALL